MTAYADFFEWQQMHLVCQDPSCSVYKTENETGDGTATVYDVFPGVFAMYNDFHLEKCPARQGDETRMVAIHHCREGRIEWEVGNGSYLYLSSGDVMVDSTAAKTKNCSFPGAHYHGITISVSSEHVNTDTLAMFAAFFRRCGDTCGTPGPQRASLRHPWERDLTRALHKDAPILILDEATASVDPENEHLIQGAISELTSGKTVIVIAHRLATIEHADQILVVSEGSIVEKGTHHELIAQGGIYSRFIRIREKAENWAVC